MVCPCDVWPDQKRVPQVAAPISTRLGSAGVKRTGGPPFIPIVRTSALPCAPRRGDGARHLGIERRDHFHDSRSRRRSANKKALFPGLSSWAVLGSNQCGPPSALSRSDRKFADLQALFSPAGETPIGAEQLSTGSRVVYMWSGRVARLDNWQRVLHLGACASPPVWGSSGWRNVERGEADAGPGGLLRAAGRPRSGRLLRRSGRVAGDLGRQRLGGARAGRRRRRRGSGDAAARRQPGERRAAALAGAGANDHSPQARPRDGRVAGGDEAAQAGLRLRPGVLVPEERQPAARAHRRREVRREISEAHEASWQAALGYLEREACIVRRGKGGACASTARGSSPRPSGTAPRGRRTRTCTRTSWSPT